jgi:hypothetical protein
MRIFWQNPLINVWWAKEAGVRDRRNLASILTSFSELRF